MLAHPHGITPQSVAELLQSFSHGLCFSRVGCAPRSLLAKGLPRHLRPKIPVKSPCYLLFSVVFAADSILYLSFPLGVLHFDALTHTSLCRGQWSCSSRSASRWGGNLLLSVPMSGFCQGLQPCSEKGLEVEGALNFGLLCFLEQNYWELAGMGRCPALVRLCPWFCPGMGLTAAFAVTNVSFLKKHVWRGFRNFKCNFP